MINKVIVVGAGGVGKTTLIQSLGEGEFYDKTTMTIEGQPHLLRILEEMNGSYLELRIYDIAGQNQYFDEERFRSLAIDTNAAIVCFDLSDLGSLEEVNKWVEILPRNAPKILVGTKFDLISKKEVDQILEEDAKKYVDHLGFEGLYSSSAKNQQSLETILNALIGLISDQN